MQFIRDRLIDHSSSPARQLFVSLLIVAGGGGILMMAATTAGLWVSGIEPAILEDLSMSATVQEKAFLMYLLAMQELVFFIIPSLVILSAIEPGGLRGCSPCRAPGLQGLILAVLASLMLLPVTWFLGRLNSEVVLSGIFSGASEWINEKEEIIGTVFDLIMSGSGFVSFLTSLLVIAILPALGEELLFRGVIQRILGRLSRSGHAAVWITAVLFSAVHLQFLGFLPRLALGAVFGYMFLWSGNIWLPVAAHFINNAVSVAGEFLRGQDAVTAEDVWTPGSELLSAALPMGLLILVLVLMKRAYSGGSEDSGMDIK
ncbi:MAG: CPBP family intramembrane metalloprotease [Bacteroidales bacterium]|nr:CPBP family intramembrane metalloprotease [Bacteroidales bacterium]MCU0408769.1 CPBP family intramembrane metalloprotease [Bacteroidales bacterium]